MRFRVRDIVMIAIPALSIMLGWLLWRAHGFDALNEWELPLATWINNLTGRVDAFDHAVIFLNKFFGEALCVVVIFTAFAFTARHFMPKPTDWRRVAMFAGVTFIVWMVANAAGGQSENYFGRWSPSMVMGDEHVNLETLHEREVKTGSYRSFPSNHGTVFFTVYFMCLLRWGSCNLQRHWWFWVLLFLFALLLSMPRVFTGAHWVSDTLLGSVFVAWLVAALVMHTPLWGWYQRMEDRLIPVFDRWMGITPPS